MMCKMKSTTNISIMLLMVVLTFGLTFIITEWLNSKQQARLVTDTNVYWYLVILIMISSAGMMTMFIAGKYMYVCSHPFSFNKHIYRRKYCVRVESVTHIYHQVHSHSHWAFSYSYRKLHFHFFSFSCFFDFLRRVT